MRVAMIALLLPKSYDISKCIEMGLIHDIAESIVGDITPFDKVTNEDKYLMEKKAMDEMMIGLEKH